MKKALIVTGLIAGIYAVGVMGSVDTGRMTIAAALPQFLAAFTISGVTLYKGGLFE